MNGKKLNKKQIRDYLKLISSILFVWIYIPHLIIAFIDTVFYKNKAHIFSDIERLSDRNPCRLNRWFSLLYNLHNNRYYRRIYYYRIGPAIALMVSWIRPADRYFLISHKTKIGPGILATHPYSSILNAKKIGSNFSCLHCTTIGSKGLDRPTIGNNVTLGAGVIIIGNVTIGDNVTIGAGSVVVKDIPSNCVATGNPARVIKYIE